MVRQRVERRLANARPTRLALAAAAAAAVVLLVVATLALAGGSSPKQTHVASGGAGRSAPEATVGPPVGPPPEVSQPDAASQSPTPTVAGATGGHTPPRPVSTTAAPAIGGRPEATTTTRPPSTPARDDPLVTDTTGPYAVEVVARVSDGSLRGWFRRADGKGSTIAGPDAYGAMTESDWGGGFGSRYLSLGAVGNASQGDEQGRIYEYGAVGTDAVSVELVLGDGRHVPATLGTATMGQLRFWVAGYWPDSAAGYGKVVATDAQGKTWEVDGGGAGYGNTP
jgi:hypothetical protein